MRFAADHERLVVLPASRAAALLESIATDLVVQARQQRAASAAAPVASTVWADPAGDGRFVHRVGPADAETLVVLIPGVGTDGGDLGALTADAERLHAAIAPAATSLAVVAWLGYDPPDTVAGAISPRPADRGAERLVADLAHLRRPDRVPPVARVVLVGHSYGGVVAGRAVAAGARADVAVLVGAPGIGLPDAGRVVGRPDVRVFAVRASDDPIGVVPLLAGPLYGPDPLAVAERLPTAATGHSAYFRDPLLLGRLADLAGEPVRS